MVSPVAVRNYWPDAKCAKAFWSQQEVRPYRRLLADTLDWAAPASGEKWLDLGCGSGPLSAGLWERSGGKVAEVIGLDCAAVNEQAYANLRATLAPPPGDRVRFRLPRLQSRDWACSGTPRSTTAFPASRSRMPNRGRRPRECWTDRGVRPRARGSLSRLGPRRAVRLFGQRARTEVVEGGPAVAGGHLPGRSAGAIPQAGAADDEVRRVAQVRGAGLGVSITCPPPRSQRSWPLPASSGSNIG